MGDIRNKINKIERAKAEKAAMESFLRAGGWKPPPPSRLPSEKYPCCHGEGCGLTVYQTKIYQCDRDGYYCLACMPWKHKQEFIGHLARVRQPFDPAEHGEEPPEPDGS